jgi:hypothetical protein
MIRLRKSFGKLVRLNVSLKGVSMSVGPRGLGSINVPLLGRKRPPRLNVNLPGPFYYSTPLVSAARHDPLKPPVVAETTATQFDLEHVPSTKNNKSFYIGVSVWVVLLLIVGLGIIFK